MIKLDKGTLKIYLIKELSDLIPSMGFIGEIKAKLNYDTLKKVELHYQGLEFCDISSTIYGFILDLHRVGRTKNIPIHTISQNINNVNPFLAVGTLN